MYVLVHHTIHDAARFWGLGEESIEFPVGLTLHQTLSAKDGTLATCLWEAPSIEAVREFLEPYHVGIASNVYREAENREGVVYPARFTMIPAPVV